MQRATQAFKTVGTKIAEVAQAKPIFSWWSMIFVIVLFIAVLVIRGKYATTFETADNIRSRVLDSNMRAHYEQLQTKRKPLTDFLQSVQGSRDLAILGNIQFSTVNGAGLLFPGRDGIFSVEAIRAAAAGGARAFVFDVWPDLSPDAEFAPVLQVIDSDSPWRRVSMNTLSFTTALNTLVQSLYANTLTGGSRSDDFSQDVAVIYLRIRGTPRKSTYDGITAALQGAIEPYRLDVSFNACAGQTDGNRLFITPLSDFAGKIIVACNSAAAGTSLEDYINCVATEYTAKDLKDLTPEGRTKTAKDIQLSMAFIAPPLDSDMAAKNGWDWKEGGHAFGVQMAAMNFGDVTGEPMKSYMDEKVFGTYSYRLKQRELCYVPLRKNPPKPATKTAWSNAPDALKGSLTTPADVKTTV
jgi:hypothetical protein